MGLIALIASFSYTFFYILQASVGLNTGSVGLRVYSISIFFISIVIYIVNIIRSKLNIKEILMVFSLLILLAGLFLTRAIYGYSNPEFDATLFSFGVRVVPAFLIGIYIAKENKIDELSKWVQPFMLLFTFGIIRIVASSFSENIVNIEFGESNYQLLSYQAINALGMNLFLLFNSKKINKFKIFRNRFINILNILILPIQLVALLFGGGRGAFVLLLTFVIYAINKNVYLIKENKKSFVYSVVIIMIIILLLSTSLDNPYLENGFGRISRFFTDINRIEHDSRRLLYASALNSFYESPVFGNGVGSIFYEFNFYSHNIIIDILVDGGITLLVIFMISITRLIYLLGKYSKENHLNEIVIICFLCSVIMLLFSGNYLRESGIWFSAGYVYRLNQKNIRGEL